MSYIYVIHRENQVLAATAKKFGIGIWARNKTDEEKEGAVITRYPDQAEYLRNNDPIRFTLEEYLADPQKQHR